MGMKSSWELWRKIKNLIATIKTVVDSILVDTTVIGSPVGADIATDIATIDTEVGVIDTEIGVIDGYHDVPIADSSNDNQIRDVVGKKDDAAVGAVGTTKSIISYAKGILTDTIGIATDIATVDTVVDSILVDTVALELDSAKLDTPKMATAPISNNTLTDVINITDKGILTGISQKCTAFTADSYGSIRITIDGTTFFSETTFNHFAASGDSNSLAFQHKFETSLRVQHKVAANSKGTIRTIVTYTTD